MATKGRAKLFQTGRSQAVRLPKEFRFAGTEVRIRRAGNAVVLEPVDEGWEWLRQMHAKGIRFDDDVISAIEEEVPMPPDNPEIDEFFR